MNEPHLTRRDLLVGALGFAAAAAAARAQSVRTMARLPAVRIPWRGIDASYIPQLDSLGVHFFSGKTRVDPLRLAAAAGINLVRLRMRVNTTDGFTGTASTLLMAQRVHEAGMRLFIDFYLNDAWDDPSKQPIPSTWTGLSSADLAQRVYDYTNGVMRSLEAQGTAPAFVQVGNEVTDGMLWSSGRITTSGWNSFGSFIKAGVNGVKDAFPALRQPRIVLHIERSGDNAASRWYYDNALLAGIPFDIIGLSYYPWWHGSISTMSANLNDLANRYKRPVWIVETAYPWTLTGGDTTGNIVASTAQLHPGYPATSAGQTAFIKKLVQTLASVPGGLGQGLCYWGGEYVAAPGVFPSTWENLALFDFNHKVLPGLAALGSAAVTPPPA